MSYIALARKWRPRTFSQLVGQEPICHTLMQSLALNRLHHAYLFTGTRGVGKTSIARILAKALNCEQGIGKKPCLQCDTCLSIEEGRFVDLIEIDGASKTRVEDTRELLDNVAYAPTNARFKIYLIDEVHMLSQHSFNALLKTLEEPPPHVKFILATTDPKKLPVTVLSRCLQFHLKHLQPDTIRKQLDFILKEEQLVYDQTALELIAKAAHGSLRDAQSLLDQVIASCTGTLTLAAVKQSLGYTQQDYALQVIQALTKNNPEQLIAISQAIASEGAYFHYVMDELLSYFHQISIAQQLPTSSPFISFIPEIISLASQHSPEDIQLFYQIIIKSIDEVHLAPTLAIGFEMMLLRLYTFKPATEPALPFASPQKSPGDPPAISGSVNHSDIMPTPLSATLPVLADDQATHTLNWRTLLPTLQLTGLALNAAEQAECVHQSDTTVSLRIAKGHRSVFTPSVIRRIEQGLTQHFQRPLTVQLNMDGPLSLTPAQLQNEEASARQKTTETALQNDPFFQQLQQAFSTELVKNSITPILDLP